MGRFNSDTVLGIDGGGSGCRFELVSPQGRWRTEAGPANVYSDRNRAISEIEAGLARLVTMSGWNDASLRDCPACLALAGVLDQETSHWVSAKLGLSRAIVEDDRPSAVEGALGKNDGFVVALGTGSFFALKTGETIRFAGGWGPRIDDRASGYWMGREALTATLEAVDGIGPTSDLTTALLERFGSANGIVSFAQEASPGEIAELARDVGASMDAKDIVARSILERAAEHVTSVLDRLGGPSDLPVTLVGGVSHLVSPVLPKRIRERLRPAIGTTLDGAIMRARRIAMEPLR